MFQFDPNTMKRWLVVAGGLLLVAGCTSSDSLVQSVRPLYQTQGAVVGSGEKSSYTLGKQYFSERRYGLALEAFQAELRVNSRSVRALNGIAACYDQLKRHDLALNYYYKALQIQPDSAQTLGNLGYSYMLQARYGEAEKMLRLALHHDPDNDRAREHLAALATKAPVMAEAQPSIMPPLAQQVPGKPAESAATVLPAPRAEAVEPVPEMIVVRSEAGPIAIVESAIESPAPAEARQASEKVATAGGGEKSDAVVERHAQAEGRGESQGVLQAIGGLFRGMGGKILKLFSPAKTVEPAASVASADAAERVAAEDAASRTPETVAAPAGERPAIVELTEQIAVAPVTPAVPSAEDVVVVPQGASQESEVARVDAAAEEMPAPVVAERERIEVSNGNGSPGSANLFAIYLKEEGERVWRITNADSFAYARSVILYRPGSKLAAERLANKLPVAVALQESDTNYPGIAARLVLGEEMVSHQVGIEKAIREHETERLFASNYSFASDSAVTVAIEVSNGNGSEGMARLLKNVLAKQGRLVARVTNAERFDHNRTVIYYQPGELLGASQVAAELPVEPRLEEADLRSRNVKVRILMGRDFIRFKAGMELLAGRDA